MGVTYQPLVLQTPQLNSSGCVRGRRTNSPKTFVRDAAGGQNVIAGYQSLFSGIGKLSQDTGNQINRSDYGPGYTLFAFDLTPGQCPGDHFELIKQGNLRLELHFLEALANTVNLIVYPEFQNVIEVDANRNVLYDYTN